MNEKIQMKDVLYVLSGLGLIVAIIFAGYSVKKWQYQECLTVGHSRSYCSAKTLELF